MFVKKCIFALSFVMSALPILTHAQTTKDDYTLKIVNNTESYGTAYYNIGPCSSWAGSEGIIKPHSTFEVSQKTLSLFCHKESCNALIYPTNNCSGSEIAVAKINPKIGVIELSNLDPEHYIISGGGTNIIVDPITKGLKGWLMRLFY